MVAEASHTDSIAMPPKTIAILELRTQVEDWKGHNINNLGDLLLFDALTITRRDRNGVRKTRPFRTYLFERILLCCKVRKFVKHDRAREKEGHDGDAGEQVGRMKLAGRIFMRDFIGLKRAEVEGKTAVELSWKGDRGKVRLETSFENEDTMAAWSQGLEKQRLAMKS